MKSMLTAAECKQVYEAYLNRGDYTIAEIANRFNITTPMLYRCLREMGWRSNRTWSAGRDKLTDAEKLEVVKAYESGLQVDEIGLRFGIQRRTVYDYLRKFGRKPSRRATSSSTEAKLAHLKAHKANERMLHEPPIQALGHLLSTITPQDIVEAIEVASKGDANLRMDVVHRVQEGLRLANDGEGIDIEGLWGLTERETEILLLIAKGLRNK